MRLALRVSGVLVVLLSSHVAMGQSCDSGACCDTGFCGAASCDASCSVCNDACNSCCESGNLGAGLRAGSWGGFAEAEVLFLRYHRDDGVRIGVDPGEEGEFDFEPGMRYTVGMISPGGLGFRGRFFEYDRFEAIENAGEGDGLGIDTFNVDLEVFDTMILNDAWATEVSAGARYNEFREDMIDVGEVDFRSVRFEGLGLVAGLELRRLIGLGHLYARVRGAVVQGDKDVLNFDGGPPPNQNLRLFDTTHAVTEIAWGYEANFQLGGVTLFARSGVEWQNWSNFSNHFDFITGEEFFDGAGDIGFAGFTVSGGVTY
jgi:hypothetical protein